MSVAKNFEKLVEKQIRENGKFIYRLYDIQGLGKGVYNICDYIAYKYPYMYCLEMKTTENTSLPRNNISDGQYYGLLEAEEYDIISGLIIWYINTGKTIFVPAHEYDEIFKSRKSIPSSAGIEIHGKKKHKYYEYDWERFFKEVEHAHIQYRKGKDSRK